MLISGSTGIVRKLFVALLCQSLLTLGACGGGGSGSGNPSASETPTTKDGAFTLSAHSADFKAVAGTTPASQSFIMNITGPNKVVYVGTGYTSNQQSAGWVNTDIQGSGNTLTLIVSVSTNGMAAGTYTNIFTVATADASKNLLQTQTFTVTLTVLGPISISLGARPQNFIIGDARTTDVYKLTVNSAGRPWKISSDKPWLKVPAGSQTTNGTIDLQIDVAGLAAGPQIANIVVTSDDGYPEQIPQSISIDIIMPQLVTSTDTMSFGGADGMGSLAPATLSFQLSAGQSTHSFTITTTTSNSIPWLKVDLASGSVGTNAQTIHVSIDRQSIKGGTYQGSVLLSADVAGTNVTKTIPVTLNVEARRIVVTADGVGFSSVPGLPPVLSRAVKIISTVPAVLSSWNARSDAAWLSVTPSGVTGDSVVLNADPTGLPTGSTSYALVTITSGDRLVENQQTIRVGLYIGTGYRDGIVNSTPYSDSVGSPVDPIFAAASDTGIDIINVYTGELLRSFSGNVDIPSHLVFSSDGRNIFALDSVNLKVIELDVETGARIASFDATGWNADGSEGLGYVRPGGYPMLLVTGSVSRNTSGHIYDLSTGVDMNSALPIHYYMFSSIPNDNQTLIAGSNGSIFQIRRSAIVGQEFAYAPNSVQAVNHNGSPHDACFSADGTKVYLAVNGADVSTGAPYAYYGTNLTTGALSQVLTSVAFPVSVKCLWNGKVVGGSDAIYEPFDIFVYDGSTGAQIGKLVSTTDFGSGNRELISRSLAVSADGNRVGSRDGTFTKGLLYVQSIP